jgi:hypothetical protein
MVELLCWLCCVFTSHHFVVVNQHFLMVLQSHHQGVNDPRVGDMHKGICIYSGGLPVDWFWGTI